MSVGQAGRLRNVYFWVLLLLVVYVVTEGTFLSGLLYLERFKNISFQPLPFHLTKTHKEILYKALTNQSEYIVYSSVLGWTIKANGSDGLARANSQGIRADREYSFLPPDRIIRISSFGDSFTHSNDVKNEDTWAARLSKLDSRIEVLNFGVGAYGLDQALLRYRQDGIPFNSQIVLIGFLSENLVRNVNVFRLFLYPTGYEPFAKPRFILEREQLTLLPNPMPNLNDYEDLLNDEQAVLSRLGKDDYFFHLRYWKGTFDFLPSARFFKIANYELSLRFGDESLFLIDGSYNPQSEAFLITAKILDEFHRSALENASLPIVLFFPTGTDIQRYRKNRTKIYAPLIGDLKNKGHRFLDLLGAFEKYGGSHRVDDLISRPFLHYTPVANELVARYIDDYLEENHLTDPAAVRTEAGVAKNFHIGKFPAILLDK